uniref:Uncharacterized protein n=1 Tax=uncultured bacterium 6 TaxID=1748280 RepID=A0A0U3SLM8_9BACT|nr:hypothetical protein [uncultured bacterium 6]
MIRAVAGLLASALLAGCASLGAPTAPAATDAESVACAKWFAQLDAVIEQHGVRDAEADRIAGFAGLRVDRLSAALRGRARADSAAFDAWLARLQRLEVEGRAVEITNLPRAAFPLDAAGDARAARQRSQRCSEHWSAAMRADATLRASLLDRAQVPDRYLDWQRALGLYPLVRWPFLAGVRAAERNHQALIERWLAGPPPTERHVPAMASAPQSEVAALWRHRPRDALGLPLFTPAEIELLFAAHAPVLEVETKGAFDRFGALAWRDGAVPAVDSRTPVLYWRVSATRYRGQWLLQLVYSLWFPERPAKSRVDLLAGALDAFVLRVTLAPDDGRPLLFDTIHGCGCYHWFVPTAAVERRGNAPAGVEWAFAPVTLPPMQAGQRIVVRLESASHYLVGAAIDAGQPGLPYDLRDESELRTLPRPDATTRSVFGPGGLVAGSERSERFLFWPMGIASAGAMRQWGHHATAFVGRRHFDDSDLIEKRFEIPALE